MSVLQILLYEEPGGQGSEDDSNEGHSVGGDKFGHSGVVDSEIGQGLVNELSSEQININLRLDQRPRLPGPHSAASAASP